MRFYELRREAKEDPAFASELAAVREWFRHWHAAWDHCAEVGSADTIGSREYARVTAEARFHRLPCNQTEMRRYISERCNLHVDQSVTDESLARRAERAAIKDGEHAD